MRKGIIRPRQYERTDSKLQKQNNKYNNGKGDKSSSRNKLVLIAFLAIFALVFWFVTKTGEDVVTVSVHVDEGSKSVRGASFELNEDDDDDDDDDNDDDEAAEENNDAEDNNVGNGEGEGEDDDDDEGEEIGESETNKNDEQQEEEEVDNHEATPGEEVVDPSEEAFSKVPDDRSISEVRTSDSLLAFNGKQLSIDSYFLKLGKKSVSISPRGSFKFVLIHATDFQGDGAYLVQGCPYTKKGCKHPDAARVARHDLTKHKLESRVLGGGRITRHKMRNSQRKGLISVFGFSRTYGRCGDCNKKTCAFIAAAYPGYLVRYSNEGYNESDEKDIKDWVKCS